MSTEIVTAKSIDALLDQYDLHTKLYKNVLVDLSEEDSNNRMNTKANHPSWIAGSLLYQRYEMAGLLTGEQYKQSSYELFEKNKGIQDGIKYPAVSEYVKDWEKITPILKKALNNVDEEFLEQTAPVDMGGKVSYYEMIYFSIDRESYMIGQLGLFRRLLGHEAMKYD